MKRKVIQLIHTGSHLMALCDDGSIWKRDLTNAPARSSCGQWVWTWTPGPPEEIR